MYIYPPPPPSSCLRVFETPLLAPSPASGAPAARCSLLCHAADASAAVLVAGAREADGVGYFEVQRMWVFAVKVK